MFEEIRLYLQESPDRLLPLGVVGVLCLLLILVPLTRAARRKMAQRVLEMPLLQRIGQWFVRNPEPIALGIGVLCMAGAVALMANPYRLLMHGKDADGVVTTVVESTFEDTDHKTRIRSTATIRFEADGRVMAIQRSSTRDLGSTCVAGCYSKGEKLKILYLAEDPQGAKVHSFVGLFSGPLTAGFVGALAFVFWWVIRANRTASKPVA
jgi:hypothetical protein